MRSDLPAGIRDFLSRHIASVEELEILLLLHDGKDRDWTPAEINERLRSQEISISKWLEALVTLKLVRRSSGSRYQFAPASEALARDTAELAEVYRERRIKVIELIYSKPNENLLEFVRAFELRKRP